MLLVPGLFQVYEHNSRDAIIASGVRSFPTFHFYCGGGKVDECRGANIQAVEQKAMQHKGSARYSSSPKVDGVAGTDHVPVFADMNASVSMSHGCFRFLGYVIYRPPRRPMYRPTIGCRVKTPLLVHALRVLHKVS